MKIPSSQQATTYALSHYGRISPVTLKNVEMELRFPNLHTLHVNHDWHFYVSLYSILELKWFILLQSTLSGHHYGMMDKPPHAVLASHIWSGLSPGCFTSDPAPGYCNWQSSRRWSTCLDPYHTRVKHRSSGSWLRLGPHLVVAAIRTVNQRAKDSLYLPPSLTITWPSNYINRSFF